MDIHPVKCYNNCNKNIFWVNYAITIMGGDLLMSNNMNDIITAAVKEILSENAEFSNVARPKPTRPSTATQGAWQIVNEPKASAATEGAWDATNTPGGVSAVAKAKWTKGELIDAVSKAALNVLAFNNIKIKGEAKPAANKIVSGFTPTGKTSSSTSTIWEDLDTPGTLSAEAKNTWTKDQLVDACTKAAMQVLQFNNIPVGGPAKPSSVKPISYDASAAKPAANKITSDTMVEEKTSASTQPAFNTDKDYEHKKLSASVAAQILTNVYKLK